MMMGSCLGVLSVYIACGCGRPACEVQLSGFCGLALCVLVISQPAHATPVTLKQLRTTNTARTIFSLAAVELEQAQISKFAPNDSQRPCPIDHRVSYSAMAFRMPSAGEGIDQRGSSFLPARMEMQRSD